ncbi:MAG TPA: phosphoadenosine phosphosulfate reductase family protein [Caldilineaceae bacterium]|nr:phosphoadenosine phosphosulfate reductase family protein [Caldilineaceae bacterium]
MRNQLSFFDDIKTTLDDSIELSIESLKVHAQRYRHWCVSYSGGKDSTATVILIAWAIKNKLIPAPETLHILYADTRLELIPLQQAALKLLDVLSREGLYTKVVTPALDERFFVYMFGYGVPPSSNVFRWCTPQLKIKPMMSELYQIACDLGFGKMIQNESDLGHKFLSFEKEKILTITGVRLGESVARDARIASSCSKDSGECGQGWMQAEAPQSVTDTLAPLLHWRLCHIYDWLYLDDRHGYDVSGIAELYGEEDIRTGCMGCPLISHDIALERLVKRPKWQHLAPLLELKPLYRQLKLAKNRLRKVDPEVRKDGQISRNIQRLGPLTMDTRAFGLEQVLDIQRRANVDLINADEQARIYELWAANAWPRKWDGTEITGDMLIDILTVTGSGAIARQPLLFETHF